MTSVLLSKNKTISDFPTKQKHIYQFLEKFRLSHLNIGFA